MMERECGIVRELLPGYLEQLTGETSNQVIARHLEECEDCRQQFQRLQKSREQQLLEQTRKDRNFHRRLRRYLAAGVLGIGLGILTLVTLAGVFLGLVVYGPPARVTEKIADYEQIFEDKIYSELLIFPRALPENLQDSVFSYRYRDAFNQPEVCIFLQGTYAEEDYRAEIARLEEVCSLKEGFSLEEADNLEEAVGQGEGYSYPAYVRKQGSARSYEYALLTGEGQITYVYISWTESEDVAFDPVYLPRELWEE